MDPYIVAAVNAGQTLATESANYIAREKARKTRLALFVVAGALAVVLYLKRAR